jgi:hypothetical protein
MKFPVGIGMAGMKFTPDLNLQDALLSHAARPPAGPAPRPACTPPPRHAECPPPRRGRPQKQPILEGSPRACFVQAAPQAPSSPSPQQPRSCPPCSAEHVCPPRSTLRPWNAAPRGAGSSVFSACACGRSTGVPRSAPRAGPRRPASPLTRGAGPRCPSRPPSLVVPAWPPPSPDRPTAHGARPSRAPPSCPLAPYYLHLSVSCAHCLGSSPPAPSPPTAVPQPPVPTARHPNPRPPRAASPARKRRAAAPLTAPALGTPARPIPTPFQRPPPGFKTLPHHAFWGVCAATYKLLLPPDPFSRLLLETAKAPATLQPPQPAQALPRPGMPNAQSTARHSLLTLNAWLRTGRRPVKPGRIQQSVPCAPRPPI